ncbi:hypothetical protein [Winogradskyella psychrotolerans]|uniref:hypothetical protein n=1 Tax=Winogradskyella psychrotolerans TaxID=1344585 RepID=UPI001C06C626|nr:hypothetical protein [Winogradskyella psychrotolerans]MBU2929774.1 hypothetical protein [Winogradskyella psychrotolerans]
MNYNPEIINKAYTVYNIKLGTVYFYENFLVAEFKEGVDITFKNFDELSFLIKTHFKDKPIGFITNRVNSYSVNVNDAKDFNKTFVNLKAYATVCYNSLTEGVIEIESQFFKFNRKVFKNMDTAISWVEKTLAEQDLELYNK